VGKIPGVLLIMGIFIVSVLPTLSDYSAAEGLNAVKAASIKIE
jgi:hypothetical protein